MTRRPSSVTDPAGAQRAARLSALLRDARTAAGVSQQSLAERAGVSIGSIAKLESARSPEPGFFLVARVVKALCRALPTSERSALLDAVHAHFRA